MAQKCGCCGSADTSTLLDGHGCLACACVTDSEGRVRTGRGNAEIAE